MSPTDHDNQGDVPGSCPGIAWRGPDTDGHDNEIFTWTPETGTIRLTSNTVDDQLGGISDDRLVWVKVVSSGEDIYTWTPTGGTVARRQC